MNFGSPKSFSIIKGMSYFEESTASKEFSTEWCSL
jgi:hypothetical protein